MCSGGGGGQTAEDQQQAIWKALPSPSRSFAHQFDEIHERMTDHWTLDVVVTCLGI